MRAFTFICPLMFFAAALLLSGCASFDYTGRSFAPHNEDAVIAWHTAKNPVPAGKYRVIGKGELKYKAGSLDSYDVEDRLLNEARKRGADAVMLEKTVNASISSYEIDNAPDAAKSEVKISRYGVGDKGEKFEINLKFQQKCDILQGCNLYIQKGMNRESAEITFVTKTIFRKGLP